MMIDIHAEPFKQGGKKYVKLPQNEFSRLLDILEEAEDVLAVRTAKRRLLAGEETVPAKVAHALLKARHGGKKIKIWREHRGLSKTALAGAVGLTGQYIGMIEAGKRQGTVLQLSKIAAALRCDVDDLI